MRDLASNIGVAQAIAPAVHTTSVNGPAIDQKGFRRVAIAITTGAIAGDGVFSVKLQESDTTTSGDFSDVPAQYLQSNAPEALAADASYKLGYLGHRRYVRAVLTKASGTSIAAAAIAVQGDPANLPVA